MKRHSTIFLLLLATATITCDSTANNSEEYYEEYDDIFPEEEMEHMYLDEEDDLDEDEHEDITSYEGYLQALRDQ